MPNKQFESTTAAGSVSNGPVVRQNLTIRPTQNVTVVEKFEDDSQLKVMADLAMIRLTRMFDRLEVPASASTSDKDRVLSILNWIASFFVRDALYDVVATAFSAQPNGLTLYIAMNRGRPEEVDRQNGIKFVTTLQEALQETLKVDGDIHEARSQLVTAALSSSGARVDRKLRMVSDMGLPSSSDQRPGDSIVTLFNHFVTQWSNCGGEERHAILEGHEERERGISPNEALKTRFEQLIYHIKNPSHDQPIPFRLHALCGLAVTLCKSNFFRTLPESQHFKLTGEEYAWLMKLKKRLWRLARYITDAHVVVLYGFTYIKSILRGGVDAFLKTGAGFRIEWVGDTLMQSPRKAYRWPQTPRERFGQVLKTCCINEDDVNLSPDFEIALSGIWSEGNLVTPSWHCELQLIHYLRENGIVVYQNKIGVSKPMCFACNAYVTNLNENADFGQPPWVLSGTSGKARHAWLIPDIDKDTWVVDYIHNEMKRRIKALVQRHSGRWDSSEGLMDPYDDRGVPELDEEPSDQ